MSHKYEQLYNVLIIISIVLFVVMPVQIKAFWYGLRIVLLTSIIIFLQYIARGTVKESKYIINFKSYFWLEILIYVIYHQYFLPNNLFSYILLGGYMVVLGFSFVCGKKIKWVNSVLFLVIESGIFALMIVDIFLKK